MLKNQILVYALYECSINSDIFKDWVIQTLLPKLPDQSVIILDNASFHKRNDIKTAITSEGHTLLFQPTYSPDLNKIEKKWAHLKSIPKKENIDVHSLFQKYAFI